MSQDWLVVLGGRFLSAAASHLAARPATSSSLLGPGKQGLEMIPAIKEQHLHEALTVPVPPKMSDKVSKKACRFSFSCHERQRVASPRQVAELAPDGLQPGQFLPAEAKRGQFAFCLEGILHTGRGGVAACGAGGGLFAAQREAQVLRTVQSQGWRFRSQDKFHFHQLHPQQGSRSRIPCQLRLSWSCSRSGLSRAL